MPQAPRLSSGYVNPTPDLGHVPQEDTQVMPPDDDLGGWSTEFAGLLHALRKHRCEGRHFVRSGLVDAIRGVRRVGAS